MKLPHDHFWPSLSLIPPSLSLSLPFLSLLLSSNVGKYVARENAKTVFAESHKSDCHVDRYTYYIYIYIYIRTYVDVTKDRSACRPADAGTKDRKSNSCPETGAINFAFIRPPREAIGQPDISFYFLNWTTAYDLSVAKTQIKILLKVKSAWN